MTAGLLLTASAASALPTWQWRAYPDGPAADGRTGQVGFGLSDEWMLLAPPAGAPHDRWIAGLEATLAKISPTAVLGEAESLIAGRWRVQIIGADAAMLERLGEALMANGGADGAWPALTRSTGVGYVDDQLAIKLADLPADGLKRYDIELVEPTALPQVWRARALDGDAVGAAWRLAAHPQVTWAVPDLIRHLSTYQEDPPEEPGVPGVPDDPELGSQWHLFNDTGAGHIDAPGAWAITTGVRESVIAIFDTGTDMDHPDLVENIVGGFDAISGDDDPEADCSGSPDGRGRAGSCPGNRPYRESHGTAVSGVAAARGANGEGGSGVCPGCGLYPVRIIGTSAGARSLGTAEAFRRAADEGAWVINNSWGPSQTQFFPLAQPEREAFFFVTREARNGLGVVLVFAAGNDYFTPAGANPYAAFPEVITVSASSRIDDFSCYSNYGDVISVSGPSRGCYQGESGIWTTDYVGNEGYGNNDYTSGFGGTSAASPVVAGLAGLVLSANPGLTAQQVRWVLESTADKITADKNPWERIIGTDLAELFGYDDQGFSQGFGYGRINAARAVALAADLMENPSPVAGVCGEDCPRCVEGRCAPECAADEECPGAWRCLETEDGGRACQRPPVQPDGVGEPCSADCEACVPTWNSRFDIVSVCTTACEDDEGCPFGFDCRPVVGGQNLCVPGNAECGTPWGEADRCFSQIRVIDEGSSFCSCSCLPESPGACPEGFVCSAVNCQEAQNSLLCEATNGQGNFFPSCVPDPDFRPSCEVDRDCPGGLFCIEGECQVDDHPEGCAVCAPCQSNDDCGATAECVDTPRGPRCLQDCRFGCPGDSVCGEVPGTGEFCVNPEWERKGICPAAYRCESEHRCFTDDDCDEGVACVDGLCDVPEAPDAGLPDMEVPEPMEMPDAGAPMPDAGNIIPDSGADERRRSSGGGCATTDAPVTGALWLFALITIPLARRRRRGVV